jgi:hypothetical protein
MKDKIENWLQRIDQHSERVNMLFGKLSDVELNKQSSAKEWSIAQNLQHLMVINGTYLPAIEEIRAGRQKLGFFGKIAFLRKFFGKIILGSVQPNRKRKMKTFPVWEPEHISVGGNLIEAFLKHQEVLKNMISDSEDLLLKNTAIASPANKNIVYSLQDAFEIIVSHEERHINQAAEILTK